LMNMPWFSEQEVVHAAQMKDMQQR
jgi:hypothetical protein